MLAGTDDHLTWLSPVILSLESTGLTHLESEIRVIHVAIYLKHVLESTNLRSSVDSAFYGIKWADEMAGLPSPIAAYNPLVIKVRREASNRMLGGSITNRKEPITVDILKSIVEGADLSNILQLRKVCLYVLSYAGFFRSEEILRTRKK